MKMISLLLLILSSCLCAATFVVNVTQSSYEAEENHSITLEWTFSTRTNSSPASLFIYCKLRQNQTDFVIYHIFMGVEASLYLDKRFTGRVQSDKDVLREGRIRLHVSKLRTEDSGLYLCDVKTGDGFNSGRCRLNVTGPNFAKMTVPDRNLISLTPQEETVRSAESAGHRSRMFLLFPIIISLSLLFILIIFSLKKCSKNTKSRASASQFGCFAPGLSCVDVEENTSQSLLVIPDQLQHHGSRGDGEG